MPEKQKTHNWTEVQTMIAAGAMLGLMALFNVIATLDRQKVNSGTNTTSTQSIASTPAVVTQLDPSSLTPVSTESITRTRSS
jgi:hypothetical protein